MGIYFFEGTAIRASKKLFNVNLSSARFSALNIALRQKGMSSILTLDVLKKVKNGITIFA